MSPLYSWNCEKHGPFDAFYRMAEKPKESPCPHCGAQSAQRVVIGGVVGDELPSWFQHPEAKGCLQNSHERPIESRTEYRKYLKERGISEHSARREI